MVISENGMFLTVDGQQLSFVEMKHFSILMVGKALPMPTC